MGERELSDSVKSMDEVGFPILGLDLSHNTDRLIHRGRSMPTAYTGETLQVLKTGTKTNSTHWQVTLKCTGCTTWTGSSGGAVNLNPGGSNRLAYAYATAAPSTPSSNTSSFNVHDNFGYWNQDFAQGSNADFQALVSKNS